MGGLTYDDSGVDIDKKHAVLERIGALVKSTFTPSVLHEPGSFGGLFDARFPGREEPILVATNDGVGTKVRLAIAAGRARGLGHDIVNHCVNDILVQGAEPLFFMDYFAASHLDPAVFADTLTGLAEACRTVGAALLGGETAEMPGVYAEGEFDLVGFLVGLVDRDHLWPRDVAAGDTLIGVRSDGLHTNGFSLVNRIVDRDNVDLDSTPDGLGESLADALLRPHRAYLEPMKKLRDAVRVHGLAHITGGGLKENLPRILPEGVGARIHLSSWKPNPVFDWILEAGPVERDEAYRVFNMGCGLVIAVRPSDVETSLQVLRDAGEDAWVMGELVEGAGVELEN